MRSWRLAAGMLSGQYALAPMVIAVAAKSDLLTQNNLSSMALTIPADTRVGDLLLACIMYRGTITVPPGWTSVNSIRAAFGSDGTGQTTHVLKRAAVAGDAGSTVTFNDTAPTPNRMSGQILALRSDRSLDALSSQTAKIEGDTGSGTTFTAPALAPSGGQLVLSAASSYLQGADGPTFYMTVSPGFTLDTPSQNSDAGNQIRLGVAHSTQGTPPAEFSITVSASGNSWAAVSVLIGAGAPPVSDIFYYNDFETDAHGFTGDWARTGKWKKTGSYSLGSTNQGIQNSDQASVLELTLPSAALVTFDGYVDGEASVDGLIVKLNNVLWKLADIQSRSGGTFTDASGVFASSASGGASFTYSKLVSSGLLNLTFINHKDGSVDAGLDGSFIDNIQIKRFDSSPPANPYFFWDFEDGAPGFTGSWAPSTEWSISGRRSLGRSNRGVINSTTSASVSVTVPNESVVEFYFYTQGETNYDGIGVNLNDVTLQNADITSIDGTYALNVASNLLTSPGGFWGKFSRRVPAGTVTLTVSYIKDQSGDVGLDGAFIDQLSIYQYVRPVVAQNLPLVSDGNNTTGSPDFYEITDSGYTMNVKQNAAVGWWKAGSRTPRTNNTGKWYYEATVKSIVNADMYGGGIAIGLQGSADNLGISEPWGYGTRIGYHADATTRVTGSYRAYGTRYDTGDVIGIGYDSDAGIIHAWKNGAYQGQLGTLAEIGIGSGGASMIPAMGLYYPCSVNLARTAKYLPEGYKIWG